MDPKLSVVASTAFALLIDNIVYSVAVPILPNYVVDVLGYPDSWLGYLFGAYAFGLLFFTPIFGVYSDRIGRRIPMLLGLLGLAVSTVLFAFATQFWQLLLARVAQGCAASATWIVGLAIISDIYPPQELGVVYGNVIAVNTLGYLIGPVFAGVLYDHVSYKSSFFVCAGLAFIDFLFRFFAVDDEKINLLHQEMVATTVVDSAELSSVARTTQELPIREILFNKNILIICFTQFSVMVCLAGFEPVWALYLKSEFSSSTSEVGYIFLILIFPAMIVSIGVGYLADRYNKYYILVFGLLLSAIITPLISLFHGRSQLVYFLLVLAGASGAYSIPNTPALPLLSMFVSSQNGRSYSVLFMVLLMFTATGTLVGPILASNIYSYFGFFWTCVSISVLMIVSIPMIYFCDPEPKFSYLNERSNVETPLLVE